MTPTLRTATAHDAAACAALVRSLSPAFFAEPDGRGTEAFFASVAEDRQVQAIASHHYLVAEHAGQIVGLAALRAPRHLFHLFVASAWQRRGVGQRLFDAVLQGSNATLPLTVNASLNALAFYRRQGFEAEGDVLTQDGIRFQPMRRQP